MSGLPETPILVKRSDDQPDPEGSTAYVLARNGLFVLRNTRFFSSCVRARACPMELARQERSFEPRFPALPPQEFARIVGFFDAIGTRHGAEAAVHLVWNEAEQRVRVVCPSQVATVSRFHTRDGEPGHPIGLYYDAPDDLAPGELVYGDVHSHVHLDAYASQTDQHDEEHSPGLHVVVGHIQREPPQVHVEAVVDGARFRLPASTVLADYGGRRTDFPAEWLERVSVETLDGTPVWPAPAGQDTWKARE